MTDESFAELFQDTIRDRQNLQPGDQVKATVIDIKQDNIFLDIGGKSEGLIKASELRTAEGELSVAPGDQLTAFFLAARDGEMIFTTRLGSGQSTPRELEEAWQAGIPVEGKVTAEVKGGFSVTVAGVRGFCPYSQMDIRKVENPESYIEQSMLFKIIEFGQRNNIVLSARAIQEEQREREREELKERLEEGMVVAGVVTSLRDFGAFVDIGGMDGLIPMSELTWSRTDKVEDVLSLGQQVQVLIKGLDWGKNRIALSLKETTANPWDLVADKYPVGSIHQGAVSRLATFGAFVTLEPGIDGLVHISKLGGGRRLNHPREAVESGQELSVKVEALDLEQKRISLAPEDYVAKGKEGKGKGRSQEPREERYTPPPVDKAAASLGTLGDLLKSQLAKKR